MRIARIDHSKAWAARVGLAPTRHSPTRAWSGVVASPVAPGGGGTSVVTVTGRLPCRSPPSRITARSPSPASRVSAMPGGGADPIGAEVDDTRERAVTPRPRALNRAAQWASSRVQPARGAIGNAPQLQLPARRCAHGRTPRARPAAAAPVWSVRCCWSQAAETSIRSRGVASTGPGRKRAASEEQRGVAGQHGELRALGTRHNTRPGEAIGEGVVRKWCGEWRRGTQSALEAIADLPDGGKCRGSAGFTSSFRRNSAMWDPQCGSARHPPCPRLAQQLDRGLRRRPGRRTRCSIRSRPWA